MARKTPRWYQRETVDVVITTIQAARNTHPIAGVVCGGGKSLIAAMLAEELIAPHPTARILVLAPSQELVSQNAAEAHAYLAPALAAQIGIYCSSLNRKDRQRKITFGTHQSVWRQVRRFGPIDYVIVDEADGFDLSLKSVRKLVEGLREINPFVRFIALTATPFRQKGVKTVPLSQCGLFTAKVVDLTTGRNYNRLVREGYVVPITSPTVRFPQIDLTNVKTKGEDYDEKALAEEAIKITEEVVSVALDNLTERKHVMWFGVNVAHAKIMRDILARRGETVTLIYGDLEKGERVEGIREFMAKETRHIVSVSALCIGFNAPHVDALVLNFATKSQRKFRQTVGRGGRPEPGKENCLVLDAGGNFARLGPINADLEQGDSRAGLWECSAQTMEGPSGPSRERSGIRFPAPSPDIEQRDLRLVLGLESFKPDEPGCGYLNDPEHMTCRNCGRPRQGFIAQSRKPDPKDPNAGIGDSYDMHDEDSIVLKDEQCVETRTFHVEHTEVRPHGDSVLEFEYHTSGGGGVRTLRLDFDRRTADNRFFAQARKYWEVSTGRKLPNEAHRVLLQREAIPHPTELTLTKGEDGLIWLTELKFVRDGQMETFRYDPKY